MAKALSPQTLSESDRRLAAAWAADCAEHVLPLFEDDAPGDDRPRDAIARARAFARGELTTAGEIARRFVAGRAARNATASAAIAAARSAAQAAGVAHMGAHALGAAAYAAHAAALHRPDDDAARSNELRWQLKQLTPDIRAALRRLPPLGEDSSGPLGSGLLATGKLGASIREIQAALASDIADHTTTRRPQPGTPAPSDLTLSESQRRELITWAGDCVTRLLPIFERQQPNDTRLRDALDGVRRFVNGEIGVGPMRTLAFACHAAARDATTPEASAVARAVGQTVAIAHMAGHSRQIARYTRKALTGTSLAEELAWQRDHVPATFASYVYQQREFEHPPPRPRTSHEPPSRGM